jgi:hypothetical protein
MLKTDVRGDPGMDFLAQKTAQMGRSLLQNTHRFRHLGIIKAEEGNKHFDMGEVATDTSLCYRTQSEPRIPELILENPGHRLADLAA